MNYSVYRLKNKVNGKLYFGITKRPICERMKQHRQRAFAKRGASILISRAIKAHGWNSFTVDSVAINLSMQEAQELEIKLISKHRTCFENGYNMTAGGESGVSLRPETRAKKVQAGKLAWKNSPAMQQSVKDPERNKKISEASKRMWKSKEYRDNFKARHSNMVEKSSTAECRARARQTYKQNGHNRTVVAVGLIEFDSLSEAVHSLVNQYPKAAASNIARSAHTGMKAYGFNWEYA